MESLVFFVAFFMLYIINELGKTKKQAEQPATGIFRKFVRDAYGAVTKPKSKRSEKPAQPQYPAELVTHTDWSVYDTPSFRRI